VRRSRDDHRFGSLFPRARWHAFPVTPVPKADFERIVAETVESLPAEARSSLAGVAVVVENAPPDVDPDVYGRYDDPARITVFMRPLLEDCADEDELREEIRSTLLRQLGQYLGIDDEQFERFDYA
jgi:predicted Zn-dependent protease with MMP-like domain